MHQFRTHNCGELRAADAGSTVRLAGWVFHKRDHGGILFIDLRDHYGRTQVVVHPSRPFFQQCAETKLESVIIVTGQVVRRDDAMVNHDIPTGEIELVADEVVFESPAETTPIYLAGEADEVGPEDLRLKYRYLDLRRESLHRNIVLRSRVIAFLRQRMTELGFNEYQTPILTSSSPEGARDFLVPSRLHPGKFYALPQAPQQFKQLLM
ncbi:MAG: aspartate--tRNA ligase, partial [Kiritimatiellae bacterium]|nr:aspartate--tRNA ligase [Kiritimatiellia bacterium]